MCMIKTQRILEELDISQAHDSLLERAVKEMDIRRKEAEEILKKGFSLKDLEDHYNGVPVVFPRLKHAYKIAMEITQND